MKSKGEKDKTVNSVGHIIISSRIRLARNLANEKFVNGADADELSRIFDLCVDALSKIRKLKGGTLYKMSEMSSNDRMLLLETRKISADLLDTQISPRGLYLSEDALCGAMINEEDHLRIFGVADGLALGTLWRTINSLDDSIERRLTYAFSEKYGYLTACPTNVGTGMRASLMMHLPALVLTADMEKVVRGVNQLGMTFRGAYGEGSDSNGAIFQLSNQQTLGVTEDDIIKKIVKFGKKIRDFELDARDRLLYDNPVFLADKIARAYAIVKNCRMIDSVEAMGNLSTLRLAADMGLINADISAIDQLLTETQPAHISKIFKLEESSDPSERDISRAAMLRGAFSKVRPPDLSIIPDKPSEKTI